MKPSLDFHHGDNRRAVVELSREVRLYVRPTPVRNVWRVDAFACSGRFEAIACRPVQRVVAPNVLKRTFEVWAGRIAIVLQRPQ